MDVTDQKREGNQECQQSLKPVKEMKETLSVQEVACILIAHVKLLQKTKCVNVVYKSHRKIDYIVHTPPEY